MSANSRDETFRDGLLDIIKNIEFNDNKNEFLENLNKTCDKIDKENKIILPADKTINFYKHSADVVRSILQTSW